MTGIVAGISNERASYIISEMPLKLVYGYEHLYFLQNGYNCSVRSHEHSLEDLMKNI